MADFARLQVLRDHPDRLAPRGQRRVGHHAHQTDVAAAEDDTDSPFSGLAPQLAGPVPVPVVAPVGRAAIDAKR
jgi:hypothetical protein